MRGERRGPAPLYVDTFDLCVWLLARFRDGNGTLEKDIRETALALLKNITLALKGRRRDENVDLADEHLIWLRAGLRLAGAGGQLSGSQLLYALERADAIGRQLGGWIKSLEAI